MNFTVLCDKNRYNTMLFQGYSVAEFTKQKLCLIFDKNLYRLNSIQFHLYSTKQESLQGDLNVQ